MAKNTIKEILTIPALRNGLKYLTLLLFPLLLYYLVISIPIPTDITNQLRNGMQWAALGIMLLLYPLFRRQGWLGELWSLSFVMILFGMTLAWVWSSGFLDGNLIGGILPWSDAQAYTADANNLLAGKQFSLFASRRPLFASLLSVLLGLTDHNLQVSLAILGAMTALACYLCAREIRRTEGALVGVVVLVVEFLYFRIYIGKILTESLGLTLGALGLALLWRGAHTDRKMLIFAGITTLTLAQNARSGALFILPVLVLWAAWYYRGKRLLSVRTLAGGLAAVALGFGLNFLLLRIVGSSSEAAFSNFSHVLFGMASGYKGWSLAKITFPGATPDEIYQRAFALIRARPDLLIQGVFLAFQDYLNPLGSRHFLVFVHFFGRQARLVYAFLILISGLGLVWSISQIRTWRGSLIIAMTLGILLSVPFAPPIDSSNMRVYAATIPFMGLLLGAGAVAPWRWSRKSPETPLKEDQLSSALLPVTLVLVGVTIVGASLAKWSGSPAPHPGTTISCPDDTELLAVKITKGSYVNLVKNQSLTQSFLPDIRIEDFRYFFPRSGYPELINELENIKPGKTILIAQNEADFWEGHSSARTIYLILDTNALPDVNQMIQFCGRITENAWLKKYHFYDAVPLTSEAGNPYQPVDLASSRRVWINNIGLLIFLLFIEIESIYQIYKSEFGSGRQDSQGSPAN